MKKNRRIVSAGLMFFFLFFFSACSSYKPVTCGDIQKVDLHGVNMKGVVFDLLVPIKNPNTYPIKVTKYDFDFEFEGVKVGKVTGGKKIEIPGQSNDVQKIPITVNFSGMKLSNAVSGIKAITQMFSQQEITIHLSGTAKAKAALLSKKIEIDQTKKIKITKNN